MADIQYDVNDGAGTHLDEVCNTSGTNCLHTGAPFKYYAFYPDPAYFDYSTCSPPAVFLFHAGGFSDCMGSFDDNLITTIAAEFARKGYVVFDIEYRTGRIVDPNPSGYITVQQSLAIYRAMQDARGATRAIIQHNTEAGHYPFKFDGMSIFVGGASAGAVIALSLAYAPTPAKVAAIFPAPIGSTTSAPIANALGPVNSPYYYVTTPSTINLIDRIKGVLNLWGEIFIPYSNASDEAGFIRGNSNIPPMIAFHGVKYPVNKIGRNFLYYPPSAYTLAHYPNLNTESNCVNTACTIYNDALPKTPDLISEGSYGIYTILKSLNVKVEFYADCKMKHGINVIGDDFGIGATSKTDTYKYIVQRAATFFQAVLSGNAGNLSRDLFIDCKNSRVKCNSPASWNDNNNCPVDDKCTIPRGPSNP